MSSIIADTIKGRSKTAPDFSEGATVTGILTATNVSTVGGVNASGIVTATSGFRATAGGLNVIAGVSTFANQVDANGCIDATGIVTASHGTRVTAGGINIVSGVSTFANQIDANGSVDITGIATASHGARVTAGGLNIVSGISTFANQIDANGSVDITGIVTASHGSRITAGGLVVTAGITTFTKDATFGGALKESVTTSTNSADVYNIDLVNGNVHKFDTNGTGAGTVYITYDGGNNVNTYMATNSTVSLSVIAKPNSAGYINAVQIDGTASGVTVEWSSDSAATPSSANDGAYDLYAFNVVKTGSSAYLVFASRTKFN